MRHILVDSSQLSLVTSESVQNGESLWRFFFQFFFPLCPSLSCNQLYVSFICKWRGQCTLLLFNGGHFVLCKLAFFHLHVVHLQVKLQCGKENQLTGASEPERCVYEFTMTTPSLCNKKIDLTSGNIDEHDELWGTVFILATNWSSWNWGVTLCRVNLYWLLIFHH